MLVHVQSERKYQLLGSTVDDAAGECFDKVGKLIGLAYPAGPQIDRLGEKGNAQAYAFPRPMLNETNDDFSFSGLKTSVRYYLRDHPELLNAPGAVRDLCASVQSAIIEVLATKTLRAAGRLGVHCVTASGGVTCNRALRARLAAACQGAGLRLLLAEPSLCTDNAGMIAAIAERRLDWQLQPQGFDADIRPNWSLADAVSSNSE